MSLLGADQEALKKDRESDWEKCLQTAMAVLELPLDDMPSRKSALKKVRLASVLKRKTAVSNIWLAARLQMGLPSSAGRFISRFREKNAELCDRDELALSRVQILT